MPREDYERTINDSLTIAVVAPTAELDHLMQAIAEHAIHQDVTVVHITTDVQAEIDVPTQIKAANPDLVIVDLTKLSPQSEFWNHQDWQFVGQIRPLSNALKPLLIAITSIPIDDEHRGMVEQQLADAGLSETTSYNPGSIQPLISLFWEINAASLSNLSQETATPEPDAWKLSEPFPQDKQRHQVYLATFSLAIDLGDLLARKLDLDYASGNMQTIHRRIRRRHQDPENLGKELDNNHVDLLVINLPQYRTQHNRPEIAEEIEYIEKVLQASSGVRILVNAPAEEQRDINLLNQAFDQSPARNRVLVIGMHLLDSGNTTVRDWIAPAAPTYAGQWILTAEEQAQREAARQAFYARKKGSDDQ